MKLTLHIQKPKPKTIGVGDFIVDRFNRALFYPESTQFPTLILERIILDESGSNGLMISGIETKNGKFILQEWWLTLPTEELFVKK